MDSHTSTPAARRQPFSHRGHHYLRLTAPDSDPAGPAFALAQPLAGRYEVGDLFAAGELSLLLRARDLRTHHDVLIKALRVEVLQPPPDLPDPATALAAELRRLRHALQAERRLLVRLRNAGCLAVPNPNDYVFGRNPALELPPFTAADGSPLLDEALNATEPYLILQLVPGIALDELIRAEFPTGMPDAEALDLITPVVATLAALHEPWRLKGGRTWHCVYQDLKPGNIVVGPSGRAVLVDFGGCQVVVDGVPVLEGACTPGYAPPECEGPPRVLLPCADVYTIGSTLYHMLSGLDPRDLLVRHEGEPGAHLDLDALPAHVSTETRRVLARCLAPRPSDRYAGAKQVAEALDTMNLAPMP
jgi:serine/threonine protein kinase